LTTTIDTREQSLTEEVKASLTSHKVFVFCKRGTLPLEWPKNADGSRAIDDEDTTVLPNGKVLRTNRRMYRNIDTRIEDERGVGAQSSGVMELDLLSKVEKQGETDAEFYARIKDWIDNSGDYRIEKYGVRVAEGNPFPIPFGSWDDITGEAVLTSVAAQLVDDHDKNVEYLRKCVQYELNRKVERKNLNGVVTAVEGPRQDVLDGLVFLARTPGDESADDAPVED
jgi:hypothetical protein